MRVRILVINGPNLNLLGRRQPHLYGSMSLAQIEERPQERASQLQVELKCFQSNHEGAIVDAIQKEGADVDGIIINPGALTHYSYAVRDALEAVGKPVVEVHISNIHAREPFRRHSVIAEVVLGQISGLGWRGYLLALEGLVEMIREERGHERAPSPPA